jgi:hypothetical protein
MKETFCVTMLGAIDGIMGAQGLCGAVLLVGLYLAVLGWKRFPNPTSKVRK